MNYKSIKESAKEKKYIMTDPSSVRCKTDNPPFGILLFLVSFELNQLLSLVRLRCNFWDLSLYFIRLTFPVSPTQHGGIFY
jgi:hypothetical protein